MNAVLFDVTKIKTNIKNKDLNGSNFDMNVYGTDYYEIEITMVGGHQVENAKVALIAIELLRKMKKIKVERSKLYNGIKNARQSGRFEIMSTCLLYTSDAADEEDSVDLGGRRIIKKKKT